ncbi:MAG: efflux RND transporter periplasmic adaptor subunit [Calditerrivibrio sp.]|nr:efflux RND transporter periplasmic adaptor subunit [Calditerrivibrio sp.]MCA1980201.1 efflux RND transporter periplasmic adaptor subunit [Calditerrivibrio sp.]
MDYLKQFLSIVIAVAILSAGYIFYKKLTTPPSKGTPQNQMMGAIPVDVYKAKSGVTIPHRLEYPSKTKTYRSIDIIARVSGYVTKINYRDGEFVAKGATIFEIEDGVYAAKVRQAEASVENQRAIVKKAESEFNRIKSLYEEKIASQQDYENVTAQYESSKALLKGFIAQLEMAKIDLGYTKVKSPIYGVLSIRDVEVGSFVQTGKKLVTIQQINPVYAEFSVPDVDNKMYDIVKLVKAGKLKPIVEVKNIKLVGDFDFIDSVIDPNTSTIKMRAVFNNRGNLIMPGDFIRIKIDGVTINEGIKIPTKAIIHTPIGSMVYIVNNGLVEVRNVTVVAEENEYSIVGQGLKDNDNVIINNIIKIRPGAPVSIDKVINGESR